ncbi:ABC transporter ATP-binding protein [Stutzerimonas nosocomialis]|uniref:ABC transporter ATP-binding protein n=1 Tax=Stutzerimonas nosocomialis TaxID=1056496 RepID=UPI00110819DD|nr:ATP-binding cassette domain-containing protein [Stutzerimonas nosocomialis]TLX57691.1 ABC transporter ATP-binding protein [Stutzerimonas nosocomialis]
MSALLEIDELSVTAEGATLLERLSLSLQAGERVTILGETGAGKSLLMQAIMGLLPPPLRSHGRVRIDGVDLASLGRAERERLWGQRIGMLPQEPWHSLDPLMRSRQQVAEVHECVAGLSVEQANRNAAQALAGVGLDDAAERLPGQLSGGMAQRLAFCAATAGGAQILLADEPTKGLDVSRRDQLAVLLAERGEQQALLTITHDVALARQLGGRVLVMRAGRLVEQGAAEQVLGSPAADYTRALIEADPRFWPVRPERVAAAQAPAVLEARGLAKQRGGKQLFEGLDLRIAAGEIIGIAGDSGCGKSSLGDILLGLLPPDRGEVRRQPGVAAHRYLKLYQDPPAAFASGVPLGRLFDDLIALHRLDPARLPPLLEQLRLAPGLLARSATEVSGGELQRLAIARALLLDPVLLFADEPVSRLDPITAREVIALLTEAALERGCALLLVSHDAQMLARTCDRQLALGGQGA